MAKYLIRTTEMYRVDSESEAKALIEAAKRDHNYTLSKYSNEYKCAKAKGEIVDEWRRVVLVKDFTAEKTPDISTEVAYSISPVSGFPIVENSEDEEE